MDLERKSVYFSEHQAHERLVTLLKDLARDRSLLVELEESRLTQYSGITSQVGLEERMTREGLNAFVGAEDPKDRVKVYGVSGPSCSPGEYGSLVVEMLPDEFSGEVLTAPDFFEQVHGYVEQYIERLGVLRLIDV